MENQEAEQENFSEELKELDNQIAFQMYLKADQEWSIQHAPLAGTAWPFHIGGNIDEATVVDDFKDLDPRIDVNYVHYLFQKLEAEKKGRISKGHTWKFTFNKHQAIYSSMDEPIMTNTTKRKRRR